MPITLILLTSILTGGVIRTMWMTPFYLFIKLFLIHSFKKNIETKVKNIFSLYFYFYLFFLPYYILIFQSLMTLKEQITMVKKYQI